MKFEDVFDGADGGSDATGLRQAAKMLGFVSRSIASANFDSLADGELVSLLCAAEEIGRFADYIKVQLTSGVVSREALPARYGFKNVEDMLREVTKTSSKQVLLRVKVAEALNTQGESYAKNGEAVGGQLAASFADGRLDLESAAMITDTIGKARQVDVSLARDVEQKLLGLDAHADDVRNATRNQVKEIDLRHDADLLGSRRRMVAKRYFRFGRERDGLVPVFGNLLPETAAKIARAFDAINSPRTKVGFRPTADNNAIDNGSAATGSGWLGTGGASVQFAGSATGDPAVRNAGQVAETRTPDQKRHDALDTIVTFGLKNTDTPMLGGEPVTLVVETTLADLTDSRGTARILDPHGYKQTVDSSLARHAACIGAVLKVTTQDGRVIGLESKNRVFTAPQRKAIMLRDGGCVIPGCDTPATWCEIHHVQEHARGGATHTDNGVTLCWWHHRYIEIHKWQISMRDGVPEVRPPRHARSSNVSDVFGGSGGSSGLSEASGSNRFSGAGELSGDSGVGGFSGDSGAGGLSGARRTPPAVLLPSLQ